MCGIAGILFSSETVRLDELASMNECLAHRGPESGNTWISPAAHVGLAHRRLSIIDTSERSVQPMHYMNRYTIVHNGEIYNYIELRDFLKQHGYSFHSDSDTEVVLAAFDKFRYDCVNHFDGMFAFAIWDEVEQELFCARDRFGEKPFHYRFDKQKRTFFFASEVKALRSESDKINNHLLIAYLAIGSTLPGNNSASTFYQNISQLQSAHYLVLNRKSFSIQTNRYWKCGTTVIDDISDEEASLKFSSLLQTSVERRLRSDVRLGTCLSGGLDSSTIAATINKIEKREYSSFSAVFPGFENDESRYIRTVTERFNINSLLVEPDEESFIRDLPAFIKAHDGPIGSASVYAQYKVFELAKHHNVTVLIDGQGADEVLGGYSRYLHWYLQETLRSGEFRSFKKQKSQLLANSQPLKWSWFNYFATVAPITTSKLLTSRERRNILGNKDLDAGFVRNNFDTSDIVKPAVRTLNDILYFTAFESGLGELLQYADRNSMVHGREVRLPFLSHELVEFVFSLPPGMKIRNGWTKWILRKSMSSQLPEEIVWRKKKVGFEAPEVKWFSHPSIQALVGEAKQKLVDLKILHEGVLKKGNRLLMGSTTDFRYLIAANLLD